jgi:hypothetical protein
MTPMPMSCRGVVVVLALCLASVACKRTPSLALKSAAEGRRVAMGVGLLPNMDRSLTRIGDVAKAINLPFDVAAIREKILSELKVPSEATKAVTLTMPISLVLLPAAAPGKEPEAAAAIRFTSADAAKQVSSAFGKPIATQGDAASYKQADGTVFWMVRKGHDVVVSTSLAALLTGANLALESLGKSEDDLVVTVSPDTIAKAQGTDIPSALAALAKKMEADGKAHAQNPAVLAMVSLMMKAAGDKLAEIDEAKLSLHIDATLGATVTTSIKPKSGSGLAKMIGKPAPYSVDPAMLAGAEPFMFAVSSPSSWIKDLWPILAPALTQGKADTALGKSFATMVNGLTGAFTFSTRVEGKQWLQTGVYHLTPDVSVDAYLDQMMALYKSPELTKWLSAFDLKVKFNVNRDKNLVTGDVNFDTANLPPEQAKAMRTMLGDKYQFALLGEKSRVLFATGKDAQKQVKELAGAGAANKPPLNLAAALEETRSCDGLMYFDLMQSVRLGLASSPMGESMGQAPGLATLSLPMWFHYRGGKTATFGWRIPMNTVRSVGTLIPLFSMFAGGGMR